MIGPTDHDAISVVLIAPKKKHHNDEYCANTAHVRTAMPDAAATTIDDDVEIVKKKKYRGTYRFPLTQPTDR